MKKYFKKCAMLAAAALLALSSLMSCSDYQDEINNLGKLYEEHEQRLKSLETLSDRFGEQLKSLMSLVNAMEGGDYIKSVVPVEGGYAIYFNKQSPITIYNGRNGVDGKDGVDGRTPDISIRQDTDGCYYWTLNGEWLLCGGQKVRANGKDGLKGDTGDPGSDGGVPMLRVNVSTNEWEVSVDGGKTWTTTGTKATGLQGEK